MVIVFILTLWLYLSSRHPVLEQQTIPWGSFCAFNLFWGLPVSGGVAIHPGQRDQLRCASQCLHRATYWLLEDHQGCGREGEMWGVLLARFLRRSRCAPVTIFSSCNRHGCFFFFFLQLDRENRIAGLFPRLTFKDKSTYVQSSTKIYDDVRAQSAEYISAIGE